MESKSNRAFDMFTKKSFRIFDSNRSSLKLHLILFLLTKAFAADNQCEKSWNFPKKSRTSRLSKDILKNRTYCINNNNGENLYIYIPVISNAEVNLTYKSNETGEEDSCIIEKNPSFFYNLAGKNGTLMITPTSNSKIIFAAYNVPYKCVGTAIVGNKDGFDGILKAKEPNDLLDVLKSDEYRKCFFYDAGNTSMKLTMNFTENSEQDLFYLSGDDGKNIDNTDQLTTNEPIVLMIPQAFPSVKINIKSESNKYDEQYIRGVNLSETPRPTKCYEKIIAEPKSFTLLYCVVVVLAFAIFVLATLLFRYYVTRYKECGNHHSDDISRSTNAPFCPAPVSINTRMSRTCSCEVLNDESQLEPKPEPKDRAPMIDPFHMIVEHSEDSEQYEMPDSNPYLDHEGNIII